ncbi:MAG TPA: hypothetical protein VK762_19570 [Polyangiaceae bacterium]|nr:hypothetical protein [Polyangiaceae bacterium]
MQGHPSSPAPPPFEPVDPRADSAPPPSGHLLAALVLFGLVGVLRVGHAIGNREVFGFEATTALLALLWWPFVARDLLAPRVRRWRERRRARSTAVSGATAPAVTPATPTRSARPVRATVIRLADRRRPRPE